MKKFIWISIYLSLCSVIQAQTFNTQSWQTSGGTKVVFYQAMDVPMVDIKLAFTAGSAYDNRSFGLSALTSSLMDQGSGGMDATQLAEQFAEKGAQFGVQSDRDMMVFNLKSLTRNDALGQAVQTFKILLTKPDFPEKAFLRVQRQQLADIKQAQESPSSVATMAFFKALYQEHPYAHPVNGTEDSVKKLTRDKVKAFYKDHIVANHAVLVIVGAITREAAEKIAKDLTSSLPQAKPLKAIPKAQALKDSETITINYPSSQTFIRLGQLGIDHHNPDYFPLLVGNYILGGGSLVSRLALEVREKRGLTYGVSSQFVPLEGEGPFLISLSTKNNQAKEALDISMKTVHDFLKEGPSHEELKAAQRYLTGSFPLSLASNSDIASLLLRIAFYHLPDDYLNTYLKKIEAVTVEDIKRAFSQQIQPQTWLLVTVGQM